MSELDLPKNKLIYLATPYTKYFDGREQAYKSACAYLARLCHKGHDVYSPIAHWHQASDVYFMKRMTPNDWLELNTPMLKRSKILLVVQMRGWKQSIGIRKEIAYFKKAGKPIVYADTMAV